MYLQCQYKAFSNGSFLTPLFGITQDPGTLNYMVVMKKAINGNLRNNLLLKKHNPNDKFQSLYLVSTQLESIHKLNFVHGDFHSGNVRAC